MILGSAVIGLLAGYGAIGFYLLMGLATRWLTVELAGYSASPAGIRFLADGIRAATGPTRPWLWFVLPGLGGLVGGWLVFRFAPEAEGHGTDAAIKAYHEGNGIIRARVPLIKGLASAITIGSGGSAGAEGPIVQIGAGLASIFSRCLKLNPARSRILLAAGMAAGVGAVFQAPTAGALFAAEILYRDMDLEFEVIIPSVVASVMGYAIFSFHLGNNVLFATRDLAFNDPLQLVPYLLMGVVLALGAYFFVFVFYGVRNAFAKWKVPLTIKPMIGGLLVGVIGVFMPDVLGQSYGIVQRILIQDTTLASLTEGVGLRFLLAVFLFKTLATAFSIGSGGSGGIFGPSLVAGAALGGACGIAAQHIFPGMNIQVGAFALVGMAGFFAAAANTPISTIIMVSELTGDYNLLVPSMWVSIFAYVLARRYSIYEHQLKNRLFAPIHQGSMAKATLRNATVGEALARRPRRAFATINRNLSLSELSRIFVNSSQASFPVVDHDGRVMGVVSESGLRAELFARNRSGQDKIPLTMMENIRQRIVAVSRRNRSSVLADLLVEPVWVHPEDSLSKALRLMSDKNVPEALVSGDDKEEFPVDILTLRDVTDYYQKH